MPRLILVVTLICLASFYYGYELAVLSSVSSGALATVYNTEQINQATFKSILTGGIPLGAIFGSLLANKLMQILPRRYCSPNLGGI